MYLKYYFSRKVVVISVYQFVCAPIDSLAQISQNVNNYY